MKYAIRTVSGTIIPKEKIDNIEFYLRVNPNNLLVKKTKKGRS